MGSGETELGELSEIISGQSPKGEFINDSEGLEFHQGKKAFSDKLLLDSGKRTQYTTKQIPKNTIVMSVRAPVGPVNITQESICIGRGLAGIIPKESNLDFLFYYLDSIKEENTGHIGATINSINRNEIMKINIPNVSIAKQETIANQIEQILELKNELVSNSREVLTKLNKLKESVLSKEFSYE
jgi:type I restriction enzyme S subunit